MQQSKFNEHRLLTTINSVVTGAGMGIGRQTAYTLAEQGASVVVLDYNKTAAEETANMINKDFPLGGSPRAYAVIADVSSPGSMEKAFEEISEHIGGGLDLFVANAGVNRPCRIEDLKNPGEYAELDRQLSINFKGTYICAEKAYPLLVEGHDPIFIMMGSCASAGSEGQGVYAGTKAALRGLLGTLVKEWAANDDKQAVRASLIEPDYFEETGLRSPRYLEALAHSRRTTVDNVANDSVAKGKVPLKREGRLVELAEKVVMMYNDTYANGNIEVLSGGKTIRL